MKKLKHINRILSGLAAMIVLAVGANAQVTKDTQKSKAKDLIVIRTFDAPVAEVWKYWSDSDHVKKWWSPTGFTTPIQSNLRAMRRN